MSESEAIQVKKYLFIEADYDMYSKQASVCYFLFGLLPNNTFLVIDQKTEFINDVYQHDSKIQDKIEEIQSILKVKATNISII